MPPRLRNPCARILHREDGGAVLRVVNELEALRDWIGREETQHDIITAAPVTALAATLDHDPHPVPDGSALLVFVTVQHELHTVRGLAISEAHDIVYRDAPTPGAPT